MIFLGGIFPPDQMEFIHKESKGVIQSAADALQKAFINGIAEHGRIAAIVNLPYIGSYPQLFRRPFYPATFEYIFGVPVFGRSFLTIKYLKSIHRSISALSGLVHVGRSQEHSVIVIYSANISFILPALIYRYLWKSDRICLILPDLPEFMGEGGILYRMAKFVETAIFYRLAKRIDYFVVLTQAMADRLRLLPDRYVVVEGIADQVGPDIPLDPGKKVFLYTGTLAARYGITHLLQAFQALGAPNVELWICGEGDSRKRIESAAAIDGRIKFFGQVTRDRARELQKISTVLINPRLPVGEFTEYSFPSKTMEYMASGRPVLMYQLSGIPPEYYDYFVSPADNSVEALTQSMQQMSNWSDDTLSEFGRRAKEYVSREKNASVQAGKIIKMIDVNDGVVPPTV